MIFATQKMPIPLMYPNNTYKARFAQPRTPPPAPRYEPPRFEKHESSPSLGGSRYDSWMTDTTRAHIVAMIGELIGTTSFLFFGLAAAQIANSKPDTLSRVGDPSSLSLLQLLFISTGFGISLAVNVWIFYRVSGGMFNPAVTAALCAVGAIPWTRGALLVPIQLVGGIVAAALVDVLFPGSLLVANSLGSGTSTYQGLVIEILLTTELIFTILMLAVEKHRATFMAPLGIGLAIFIAHLLGVSTTGASVNPARSLGPAVMTRKFVSYYWIYWLGPFLGAGIAVALHKLLKFLQYETANRGQDDDGIDIYRVVPTRRGSNESFSSLAHFAHM